MHRTSEFRRRTSALVAATAIAAGAALSLGAPGAAQASAKLIVCGPAGKQYVCNTYCRETLANGNNVDYPEGTTVTFTTPDGRSQKVTCRNGEWVPAAAGTPPARNLFVAPGVAVLTP
jgi:hypothetical protein